MTLQTTNKNVVDTYRQGRPNYFGGLKRNLNLGPFDHSILY